MSELAERKITHDISEPAGASDVEAGTPMGPSAETRMHSDIDFVRRPSDNGAQIGGKFEEEDFHELLTETFKDVDTEDFDFVDKSALAGILDVLVSDELIAPYDSIELEELASDMDADDSGRIPLNEYLDVLTRRQHGEAFHEVELEEAFKSFNFKESGSFGSIELRQVMSAMCDVEINSKEANMMIEAAATTPGQTSISYEEFKAILFWRAPPAVDALVPPSS